MTQRRNPPPRRNVPPRRRELPRRRPPKRRRNWKAWLTALVALAIALLALWLTLIQAVFVVRHVEIVGVQNISEAQAVRACGIQLGTRMNALNQTAIESNVESTGALAFVALEKRYPVTVRVTVRERSRDAMILQAGKLLVLDSDGYVVSASESMPDLTVPYVTGLAPNTFRIGKRLDATPERLSAMKAVLEALKARDAMAYISELDVDDPSNLTLLTRTGMTVLLGDASNMDRKIIWMAGALKDLDARGETLGRLDVSSGTRADYLPMVIATPTPAPTQNLYLLSTPTPEPTETPIEDGAVIGEDAI